VIMVVAADPSIMPFGAGREFSESLDLVGTVREIRRVARACIGWTRAYGKRDAGGSRHKNASEPTLR